MSLQSGERMGIDDGRNSTDPASAPDFTGGAYRANLYVYDPAGRINWYALPPRSFAEGRYVTIGRAPDCNIPLADGSVSTRHASLSRDGDQLILKDLGSTNGVLVNDERVEQAVLSHGDVLRMGATDVRFLYSFRECPAQLVLEFRSGPNAGKSIATYGCSTGIGRLNCAVNLQGRGVSAQHARVDAFGRSLIFVVNLRRENETWLNEQRLKGIVAAREGDRLRIGEHEMVLRVVEDADLIEAIPGGDGTLAVGDAPGVRGKAPIAQMSAFDFARLEARIIEEARAVSSPTQPGLVGDDDKTALDLFPLSGAFVSPTSTGEKEVTPAPPLHPPVVGQAARPERPAPRRPRPALRHRRAAHWSRAWVWVLVLLSLIAATVVTLRLIPVPRTAALRGRLDVGARATVVAPVKLRVLALFFNVGDRVQPGDALVKVQDLDKQREIDRLSERIEALRKAASTPVMAPTQAPGRLRVERVEAKARLRAAEEALGEAQRVFDRREITFSELQVVRDRVSAAQRTLAELEGRIAQARGHFRVVENDELETLLAEIGRLTTQRERLQDRSVFAIHAPSRGVALAIGGPPLRKGAVIGRQGSLYVIGDDATLTVRLNVPGAYLGALETSRRVTLRPEGYENLRIPATLGEPAAVAAPDGSFPAETIIDNSDLRLRPGQRVLAQIEVEPTNALAWLFDLLR